MKKITIVLSTFLMLLCVFGCSQKTSDVADMVVYGTIYTAEEDNDSIAEAFAVKDGKFIYVGDKNGAQKYIEEGKTEVIDKTNEGLIIPGCTEGHNHYFGIYGVGTMLPGYKCSYEEMLDIIAKEYKEKGPDMKQFISFGINTAEMGFLALLGTNYAEELEAVAPNIPVVIIDDSGHDAICNITALKMADLYDNPKIRGGEISLDADGHVTGYIKDQAVGYVVDNVIKNPLTDEELKKGCEAAINILHEKGYTSAFDAWIDLFTGSSLYKVLNEMDNDGELTINVSTAYNVKSYDADNYKERVDEIASLNEKYQSTHYHPQYIKLFADGVTEIGTGWLLDGYNVNDGEEKQYGNIIWSQEELNALVEYANSKGILIHTHAFGDGAGKAMINAYIASNEANKGEYRNSLGHVRNIRIEDIKKAAENKISIAENLIWHIDYDETKPLDKVQKDFILYNVPSDIYEDGYPMKSLVDNGVIVSSSTDSPVAEILDGNIVNILGVATTGCISASDGTPFGANELLSVKEALDALTINGAWQLGLEKERGSIKVGKYADFVILDQNILEFKEEELKNIFNTQILNTYFEGKNVYSK